MNLKSQHKPYKLSYRLILKFEDTKANNIVSFILLFVMFRSLLFVFKLGVWLILKWSVFRKLMNSKNCRYNN